MTPFLSRHAAEVAAFAAAVRAGDDTAPAAFCDWLDEREATAADVCVLYAVPCLPLCPACRGRCGGGLNGCAACGTTGKDSQHRSDQDDSLRPILAEWAARHGPPGRAAEVRGLACERGASGMAWWVGASRTRGGNLAGVPYDSEPAARRELKRRVLGLWAEVRVACPACGGKGTWRGKRGEVGSMWCEPCRGSGAVAPADLIPPEPGVLFHPDPSPEWVNLLNPPEDAP